MGRYKIGIGCLAGVAVLLSILLASKQEPLPEYDPIKKEETTAERRVIFTEYELPTGDAYRDMLMKIMQEK